jgi:hypothetical protein
MTGWHMDIRNLLMKNYGIARKNDDMNRLHLMQKNMTLKSR